MLKNRSKRIISITMASLMALTNLPSIGLADYLQISAKAEGSLLANGTQNQPSNVNLALTPGTIAGITISAFSGGAGTGSYQYAISDVRINDADKIAALPFVNASNGTIVNSFAGKELQSNKSYYFYAKRLGDETYADSLISSSPRSTKAFKKDGSSQTISINGTIKVREELSVNISNVANAGALTYSWKSNGIEVSQEEKYKIASTSVGQTISVEVISINYNGTINATTTTMVEATTPDKVSDIKVEPLEGKLNISWKIPDGGGSGIDNFVISTEEVIATGSAGIPSIITEDGTQNAVTIYNLKNDVAYSINVVAVNGFGESEDSFIIGNPENALKATISIKTPNENDGKVVITRHRVGNDTIISSGDKIPVGTYVTLEAIPTNGKRFSHWTVDSVSQPSTFSFNTMSNVGDVLGQNPLTIKIENGVEYSASFVDVAVVPKGNPELSNFYIVSPDTRQLIAMDGKNTPKYNPKITDYNVYLRSIDTKDISFGSSSFRMTDVLSVSLNGGNSVVVPRMTNPDGEAMRDFEGYNITVDTNIQVNKLAFKITNVAGLSTTYNVNIISTQNYEQDPHIFAEISAFAGAENATFSILAKNISILTTQVAFNINDTSALSGFADQNNIIFNNDLIELGLSGVNYSSLNPIFRITSMKSNGTKIVISLETKSGKPVTFSGNEPTEILKINLMQDISFDGTLEDMVGYIDVVTNESSVRSPHHYDIYDSQTLDKKDEKMTLTYVQPVEATKLILAMNNNVLPGRFSFELYQVIDGEDKLITRSPQSLKPMYPYISGNDPETRVEYDLFAGTFFVKVMARGYITLTTTNTIFDGVKIPSGIRIGNFSAIPGDLNGDNIIDGGDRALLISIMNHSSDIDGSGTDQNGDKIFANYNADKVINSLDLGILLRSMTTPNNTYAKQNPGLAV